MECKQVLDSLYDFATNKLDETEHMSVDAHLKKCQNCREELLLLQDTLPILDTWESPRLSPETVVRMTESILDQQIPWWKRLLDRIILPPRFMLPMQALAMACLILVVVPFLIPKGNDVISKGGLTIDMSDAFVTNPIRLRVENVPGAVSDIKDLLEEYQGNIRQQRNLAMVIEFDLDESKKQAFFGKLAEIGGLEKPDHGYQTEKGTVFIVIMEK